MKNYIIALCCDNRDGYLYSTNKRAEAIINREEAIEAYSKEVEALESEYVNVKRLAYSVTDDEIAHAADCALYEYEETGDPEDWTHGTAIMQSDYYMPADMVDLNYTND